MRPNDRRIDHVGFRVLVTRQLIKDVFPHAPPLPAREPRIHGLPGPEPLWQIPPRRPRPYDPQHRIHHRPMALRRRTHRAPLGQQQVRYAFPLLVAQLVTPRHPLRWSVLVDEWTANSIRDMEDTASARPIPADGRAAPETCPCAASSGHPRRG
jgi:hypothetical protein